MGSNNRNNNHCEIFRKLADVSRSTRGVVLLLCDLSDTILVMNVAKRLSMIDGHFVWIWIDTTTKPASFLTPPSSQNLTQKFTRFLDKTKNRKGGLLYPNDDPNANLESRGKQIRGTAQKIGNRRESTKEDIGSKTEDGKRSFRKKRFVKEKSNSSIKSAIVPEGASGIVLDGSNGSRAKENYLQASENITGKSQNISAETLPQNKTRNITFNDPGTIYYSFFIFKPYLLKFCQNHVNDNYFPLGSRKEIYYFQEKMSKHFRRSH